MSGFTRSGTVRDWNAYLSEANRVEFANPSIRLKYLQLCDSLSKSYALSFGDLRHKNCAKQIIKEKTQEWLVAKGSLPWCFRFQCLITGRKSKYIKEDELHVFGITNADKKTGGDFPFAQDLPNKLQPVRDQIQVQLRAIHEKAFQFRSDWWQRYSEYLSSEEWYDKRQLVLVRDNYKCRITGETSCLEVHHLTYQNVGKENPRELITVCRRAHQILHDKTHIDYPTFKEKLAQCERFNHGT